MDKLLFTFEADTFEKSEDGEQSRKICGYASTESLDRQGETLIQKGLDFSEFLEHGWFNYNHSREVTDILGYPTKVEFHKGMGWYVEGYLLKGFKKADDIWELAQSLQKSDRKLGFSVEGGMIRRDYMNKSRITSASVRHVAITHVPVNPTCTMEVLSKSMCKCSGSDTCMHCTDDCDVVKGMTTENGAALIPESLEGSRQEHKCSGSCANCTCNDDKSLSAIVSRGYTQDQAVKILAKLKTLGYK